MNEDWSGDISVSTPGEFKAHLRSLLVAAYDNDCNLEGGWACRNGDAHPDWDVVIVEMAKPEEE